MKKIGLMGCGTVADYGHLPAIKSVPEWELFAIFDPVQETFAQSADDVQRAARIRQRRGVFLFGHRGGYHHVAGAFS